MSENIDNLKLSVDPATIAAILAKWGQPVLTLVEDCLKEGFTMAFIQEALTVLGPLFLHGALTAKRLTASLTAQTK